MKELQQDYAEVLSALTGIETYLKYNKPVYTREEMLEILRVDSKTLKKYMDEGLLGYSEPVPGGRVFFSPEDLKQFLTGTHKDAFAISDSSSRRRVYS